MAWPRITLVTPSFNQARYLEETIRSVLDQGYPNLQYGIVDGGSTDESISVIERYYDQLDFVIIEPDRGQSDAINKGLRRADGAIVGWLNSDDTLLPGSLRDVARHFSHHGESDWLIGCCREINARGETLRDLKPEGEFTLEGALLRDTRFNVPQPATFWRRRVTDAVGLLDETLHFCMDFDLWCRFLAAGVQPTLSDLRFATYRLHETSKTCSREEGFHRALIDIERRYLPKLPLAARLRLRKRIGYQARMIAVRQDRSRVWREVLRRPWWLGSQQVRARLFGPDMSLDAPRRAA